MVAQIIAVTLSLPDVYSHHHRQVGTTCDYLRLCTSDVGAGIWRWDA